MGEVFDLTKSISDYLHNGTTWMRFKAIAVQPIAQGGLALCTEGDAVYAIMFGMSPPKHQDERPATTMALLRWLQKHQVMFSKLATCDHRGRSLNKKFVDAAKSLAHKTHCVLRRIGGVLLHKALFLFHYIEGKQHIAMHTTLARSIPLLLMDMNHGFALKHIWGGAGVNDVLKKT